ncbi:MAG: Gfo/Idh/MocA family oxidoreductase [Treponema sp.]|nr:Gfo/Idh/MocA family oxidoreductase [Treponema sp.]
MGKLRIGIVGIGKISGIYLKNLTGMFSKRVSVSAVTDIVAERAAQAAEEYHIRHLKTIDEMTSDPEVDIILNLTQPQIHHEVAMKAVNGGKHVYNEKPLCAAREEAAGLLQRAAEKKVRVGGAPDTFLGAGIQTCRKLIDHGWIGRPVAASAFMLCHGHEHWHPAPEFYYKQGGGPLFDMGPYYLTALINLLGPVTRVSGSAQKGQAERIITSEPLNGTVITVDVPTHIAGILDFASGAVGTIITSFDVWSSSMPFIEIYGTEGTMQVPDPNYFRGEVRIRRFREENWSLIPLILPDPDNPTNKDDWQMLNNWRGIGITDMAEAIWEGRPHRASGELAYHVLDIMHGIHDASASGKYYEVKSSCSRPEPVV